MKRRNMVIGMLAVMGCLFAIAATPAWAADLNLVGLLTQQLGVTTEQAKGGAGAILDVASKNMSTDQFTKVTDALPDVSSLLKSDSTSSAVSTSSGGLSSLLSKSQSSLSSLAGLTTTFSNLGLGSDMIGKFTSVIMEYAQSKGGSEIASLLKSALQ